MTEFKKETAARVLAMIVQHGVLKYAKPAVFDFVRICMYISAVGFVL